MKKVLSVAICVITVISMSVNICAAQMMQKGSRGDDVRKMQEELITLGYLDSDADGIFGPKTEAAVLAFQKDNGLDAQTIEMAHALAMYPDGCGFRKNYRYQM